MAKPFVVLLAFVFILTPTTAVRVDDDEVEEGKDELEHALQVVAHALHMRVIKDKQDDTSHVIKDKKQDDKRLKLDHDMLAWASHAGTKGADHLEFKTFPKGADKFQVRGVATSKAYKKGQTVVEVPQSLLMWSEGKETLQQFKKLGVPGELLKEECGGSLDKPDCRRIRLVAGLLKTKESPGDTHWGPYVKQLPGWKDFWYYHPAAAEEPLLQAFEKLPITKSIRDGQKLAKERYEKYTKMGGKATEEDFKWANLVVHAYAWGMKDDKGSVLVPIGDSFNTAPDKQQNVNEHFKSLDEGGGMQFVATKDIAAGTEILDHYLTTDDDAFVKTWGFPLTGEKMKTLSKEDCTALKKNIGDAVKTPTGQCKAPSDQPQAAAFCSMARVALEHCQGQ